MYKEYIKQSIKDRTSSLRDEEIDDLVKFIFDKGYDLEHLFSFSCPIKYVKYIREIYEKGKLTTYNYCFLGKSTKICYDSFGGTNFHISDWDVEDKQAFAYIHNSKMFLVVYQPEKK